MADDDEKDGDDVDNDGCEVCQEGGQKRTLRHKRDPTKPSEAVVKTR